MAAWPDIVAEVRERSRFLGEALGASAPIAVESPWLTVALAEPNPLFAEKLQAEARVVEEVLRTATGRELRLRVTEAVAGSEAQPPRPKRLSDASMKADRLKSLRARDPALDMAAESLDLEIVE